MVAVAKPHSVVAEDIDAAVNHTKHVPDPIAARGVIGEDNEAEEDHTDGAATQCSNEGRHRGAFRQGAIHTIHSNGDPAPTSAAKKR